MSSYVGVIVLSVSRLLSSILADVGSSAGSCSQLPDCQDSSRAACSRRQYCNWQWTMPTLVPWIETNH